MLMFMPGFYSIFDYHIVAQELSDSGRLFCGAAGCLCVRDERGQKNVSGFSREIKSFKVQVS